VKPSQKGSGARAQRKTPGGYQLTLVPGWEKKKIIKGLYLKKKKVQSRPFHKNLRPVVKGCGVRRATDELHKKKNVNSW